MYLQLFWRRNFWTLEYPNIVEIDPVFCPGEKGGAMMMRSASSQPSHLIPDAIRVAMGAVDGSTAATSATYVETVLPDEHESVFVEIPVDKSNEMEMGVEHEHHVPHHHESRRTIGQVNDELRFSIIDAVYLRPAIWDHGRELRSLGQRKDHFIEIAALLSTDENLLSCHDIEKQWKNLKDSYFKLRKKVKIDASGKLIQPRWKYFSAMMFLDRLSNGSASFSGANTSVCDETNDAALVRQDSFLGKRNADGNLTAVASGRHFIDGRCRIRKGMISTSNSLDGESTESTVVTEDEYSAFCNSLIYPLREIGSMNRLEYIKLQKLIRDAIYEKQMELLENESAGQ
uniref:MADF domain-containing protein n=1 Tax=Elaeophora elaphi TaxID=1147741 RepID=A0A0R3S1I1_9BILA